VNNKKIIKIVIISICIIGLFILFMYRVKIYNTIVSKKVTEALQASDSNPDYVMFFANNVEVRNNGYSSTGEVIMFFKEAKKILYGNDNDRRKKVLFTLGSDKYYEKGKLLELEEYMLEVIGKYKQSKFEKYYHNSKISEGDVELTSFTRNGSINSYRIKKVDASELYELLDKVKKYK